MVLKVEIISKETIKPSINLRTFKLSFLDQITPPIPINILLFYNEDSIDNVERSDRLKKSLSETLTRFYPFREINDNLTIQCDDYGVHYLETQVNCQLSTVLKHPEAEVMNQFFPSSDLLCNELGKGVQLATQVNMFDCGGMVIGMTALHKIIDAGSLSTFINAWSRAARGTSSETLSPSFDSASLFPPMELFETTFQPMKMNPRIAALRAKASHHEHVNNPTRVESVSALLWKCAPKVGNGAKSKSIKPSVVNVIVNFRSRMVPPLPENSFGNLIGIATTKKTSHDEAEMHYLVGNLRDATRKIDGDYMRELQVDGGLLRSTLEAPEQFNNSEVELYTMTSWCRFPFYEVDFGWGKPIWVCTVNLLIKNGFILMDTRCGSGVEAWVTLDEHKMAEFESDLELREFISTNQMD
ncbi:Transferase [Macleaya cordata]|uniref:Transferase n=1 Tax=Macleaya cordata TaxID=56857 RepID=A0A200R4C6_MACCD|nr:Transferase [Macleaya cordata]